MIHSMAFLQLITGITKLPDIELSVVIYHGTMLTTSQQMSAFSILACMLYSRWHFSFISKPYSIIDWLILYSSADLSSQRKRLQFRVRNRCSKSESTKRIVYSYCQSPAQWDIGSSSRTKNINLINKIHYSPAF